MMATGRKTAKRRLFDAYHSLSRRIRKDLAEGIMPRVEASDTERRRELGDLAVIDLSSSL
jgi:hypothetical protein